MIPGISYWSLEHGSSNALPLDDALRVVKAAGFKALELTLSHQGVLHTQSSQAECQAARRRVDASGLHVSTVASGLNWGCNPVSNDAKVRDQSNAITEALLQRTAWLGCEALLYVPGIVSCPFVPDQKVCYDHALTRCRENLTRLLPIADRLDVDLCIENVWNGMFLSPVELAQFVDSFRSRRLGVYLDLGNLLGYHQHPPHWIEVLGSRIKRVHVKDFKHNFGNSGAYSFCRLGEGDVPFAESVTALRTAGYEKTLIAEMMPYTPGLLEHTAEQLLKMLASKRSA